MIQRAISTYALAVVDYTTFEKPNMSFELQQGLAQVKEMIRVKYRWNQIIKFDLVDLLYRF